MITTNAEYPSLGKATAVLACVMTLAAVNGAPPVDAQTTEEVNESVVAECVVEVCARDEGIDCFVSEKASQWVRFQALVQQWREERGGRSLHSQIAILPSYQHILGMGPGAIPFILAELESEGNAPDHIWFLALAAITHDNPVPPNSRGKLLEMAKAWIEWGKIKGYVQVV